MANGKDEEPEEEFTGASKGELKRLLKLAQQGPVNFAFAVDSKGKAIVLVDRRKPPRTLEKELKDGASDSKNHRFGKVSVDANDAKLVHFTVNKAAGGMERKLVAALKGTGFSKVEVGPEE